MTPSAVFGRLQSDRAALAAAIAALPEADAVSLPLLGSEAVDALLTEAARLRYRPAQPVIGSGDKQVWQDCEVSCAVPNDGALATCGAALEGAFADALGLLGPAALSEGFAVNDLIVQRYPKGSGGITPHRDHIAYRGLVSVITLAGRCRFAVCRDRSGSDARAVAAPPGWLVLMRGPGLYGRTDRPFHFVDRFETPRISVGLRYDRRLVS